MGISANGDLMPSEKKQGQAHVEEDGHRSDRTSIEDISEFSKEDQHRIIRKVDIRLIGTLGVINCIALMDRLNLSAASIAGMTKDLELNIGYRYSLIVLVFFITYILFEAPMAIACRKIGPRQFLACITLTWGVLMMGFGFAQNWTALLPLRLALGLCEGGFYPGSLYLISTWYTRFEVQKRYTVFYSIGIIASAFSGILAYGLMQMDGVAGLAGWRWIFIMEGILTFIIGCLAYFTLVDFPDQILQNTRRFLKENEIRFIIQRINDDRGDVAAEPFNFKKWLSAGRDIKIWAFAMLVFCGATISYSVAYFLPIILRNNMGFSVAKAQCLVAPPYAFAALFMYCSAWVGDKYHVRGPVLVANAVVGLIGLPIMAYPQNSIIRYLGVFLVTGSSCAILPTTWAYQANNVRGQWKRAFGSATLVGFAGIGGIAGGLVFRSQDGPLYRPGIYAAMACNGLIIVIVAFQTAYFRMENRKAETHGKVLEGSAEFRYTI